MAQTNHGGAERNGGQQWFRSGGRAAVWCFARTARDQRLAAVSGRPIGQRDLRRLLFRRLGNVFGKPVRLETIYSLLQGAGHKGRDRES